MGIAPTQQSLSVLSAGEPAFLRGGCVFRSHLHHTKPRAPRTSRAAHPATSNVSGTTVPLPARNTASPRKLSPTGTPTPPVRPEHPARVPLAMAPVQSRNRRVVAIAAVVGFVVLAVVGLAFSDFNL